MNFTALQQLFFGSVTFPQSEEYEEFRYKLLIVLMLTAALVTAVLMVGEYTQVNLIHAAHMRSMRMFTVTAIFLWVILRNRKHLFKQVAWTYEVACLFENTSALLLVPHDELRILWFFLNVPGVYILLGQRAGMSITVLSVQALAWLFATDARTTCQPSSKKPTRRCTWPNRWDATGCRRLTICPTFR